MKEKIMYLILGILIGAVITAGCFLVFSKDKGPRGMEGEKPDFSDMTDEERNEMMEKRGKNVRPEDINKNEIPEDIPNTNDTENITNNATELDSTNSAQ